MPFTIPNEADAAFADQAELHSRDFDILTLGLVMSGVVSGGVVSAQGTPDNTVAVSSGAGVSLGKYVTWTTGNVTMVAADATNPRFDLVYVDRFGTRTWVAGTAGTNPTPPAVPTGGIPLAVVYIPANDNLVNSTQIVDKRVLVPDPEYVLFDAPASTTTITAAIASTTATTFTVADPSILPPTPFEVRIDSEELNITNVAGSTLTATRGTNPSVTTTLASAITTTGQTGFYVSDLTDFPYGVDFVITVDSERMLVTGGYGTANTTLAADITSGATTLTVRHHLNFLNASLPFRIQIDSEEIDVTAGAETNSWTIARGANGTTPAAHTNGAFISHKNFLTATRAHDGTTAATHSNGATVTIYHAATHSNGATVTLGPWQSAQLNAYLSANAGKRVRLRAGTYLDMDGISLPANTTLEGWGNKQTTIQARNFGVMPAKEVISLTNDDTMLFNLIVDGRWPSVNSWGKESNGLIRRQGNRVKIVDCVIQNVSCSALYQNGPGFAGGTRTDDGLVQGCLIQNVQQTGIYDEYNLWFQTYRNLRIKDVGKNGVKLKGQSNGNDGCPHSTFLDIIVDQTGQALYFDCLALEVWGGCHYATFANCHILGPTSVTDGSFFGISVDRSDWSKASNCHIKDTTANNVIGIGLEVASSKHVTYTNCSCFGFERGALISNVNPAPDYASYISCKFERGSSTAYAIEALNGVGIKIEGCTFVDAGTRAIMLNAAAPNSSNYAQVVNNDFWIRDQTFEMRGVHITGGIGHLIAENTFGPFVGQPAPTSTQTIRPVEVQGSNGAERHIITKNRFNGAAPTGSAKNDHAIELDGLVDNSWIEGNTYENYNTDFVNQFNTPGSGANWFRNNIGLGGVGVPTYRGLKPQDRYVRFEDEVPALGTRMYDEFTGGLATTGNIGNLGWSFLNGTAPTAQASEAGRPGICRMQSSATNGTIQYVFLSAVSTTGVILPADYFDLTFGFRVNQVDANFIFRCGLANSAVANPPNDGIFLEKLAADTAWFGVTRAASVQTRAPSSTFGAIVSGLWYRVRIRRTLSNTVGIAVDIPSNNAGTATSSTATTLVDTSKSWTASQWIGARIVIKTGTGAGQTRTITASGTNSVTVATWTTNPDTTSTYEIVGIEWTSTTNIPTVALSPFITCGNSAAANKTADVDYVEIIVGHLNR